MQKDSSHIIAYLAAPYSHPDPKIKEWRLTTVAKASCALFKKGIFVFSPLTHNIAIDAHGINGNWQQWGEFDLEMLARCDKLIVLKLPGWEDSKGVKDEIEHAQALGLPIEKLEFPLT